jgi:flagellar biosynthesis/type III secretory pathway M-ring protein FliF/YscJ
MLAMRPALTRRESHRPADKLETSKTPAVAAAQNANGSADASPDLATRIAQARQDARRDPARAAMLLRLWMSEHG